MKPSGPGIFFVGRFLKNYSFNLLTSYRSVQIFLFLCDSVLVGCIFLGICSLYLSYPICWHRAAHSTLS